MLPHRRGWQGHTRNVSILIASMSATGSRFREPQIGIGTGRDALRIRIEADADEELGDACQLNEPDPFGSLA